MIYHALILDPENTDNPYDLESAGYFADSYMPYWGATWDKLSTLFVTMEAWTYAKPDQKYHGGG